jgi:hypothetical protein
MTPALTAKIVVRFVYGVAILIALIPLIALAADPGDPIDKHVFRFITCPLVAAAVAGVGMLLSLLLRALVIYIERHSASDVATSGDATWLAQQ